MLSNRFAVGAFLAVAVLAATCYSALDPRPSPQETAQKELANLQQARLREWSPPQQ